MNKCEFAVLHGRRRGEICNRKTKGDGEYCTWHMSEYRDHQRELVRQRNEFKMNQYPTNDHARECIRKLLENCNSMITNTRTLVSSGIVSESFARSLVNACINVRVFERKLIGHITSDDIYK